MLGAAVLAPLLHQVALEVVHRLDKVAGVLDHPLGRLAVRHEAREAVAVVVDVHDVRAGEGGAVGVDDERVRLVLHRPVRLRLKDDTHRRVVLEHRAHTVGHSNKHVCAGGAGAMEWGRPFGGCHRMGQAARARTAGGRRGQR